MLTKKYLGSYRILGRISSGGMGDVYLGEDTGLERRIAIKALKQELVSDPDVIERFKLEAITLAKLNHPNVTTVYAFLEDENSHYLVIELISGWELSKFIEKVGALPLSVSLYLYKQVLAGISAVHAEGIVHRDLKPSNIMVTENLIVKVMDFGIARFQTGNRLTRHGKLIGTIEYMSPEQIMGKDATVASDIYSLGVLLFEMVTGRAPFSGDSEYEVMRSQVENPPPSPLEFKADIPDKLVDVLSRALAKAPEARYPSTEVFLKALDETDIDTSNATNILYEFICTHQLEQEKTTHRISELIDVGNGQEAILTRKSNDSRKQNLSYVNSIYGGLISVLARRPWLGPLILFISFAIVGGLMLKRNLTESANKPIPEEIANLPTDANVPDEITTKDTIKITRSKEIPESVEIDTDKSPVIDLNLKGINKKAPDDQTVQPPLVNIQPFSPSQSVVGLTAEQPSSSLTPLSPQLMPITDIGATVEQSTEAEELPTATRKKIRPKPSDDHRRGSSEWVIHKE